MEDIEVVIRIPKETYDYVKKQVAEGIDNPLKVYIANGTPLPKGYGDLVDRDGINSRYYGIYTELESLSNKPSYKELLDKLSMCLDTATPIIKADKESEDA
jgi:hypothetical protein